MSEVRGEFWLGEVVVGGCGGAYSDSNSFDKPRQGARAGSITIR